MRRVLVAILLLPALCVSACASTPAAQPAPWPRTAAIMCATSGAPPRRIAVPEGTKPEDLCPQGTITDRFYGTRPGVLYSVPDYADVPAGRSP